MKHVLAAIILAGSIGLGWLVYQGSLRAVFVPPKQPGARPTPVHVTRMQTMPIEERVDLVGDLDAVAQVEVRSRVSGYITHIGYDVGDFVDSGKPVVSLDDSKSRELVARAEAMLKVAKAQLSAQQARANNAKEEVERVEQLTRSGVSTEQQRLLARTAHEVALAEIDLEKARVAQAESELLSSKLALNENRVTSPISGFVAERPANVGDLANPEALLMRIVDITRVHTMVHIVERDYHKVRVGQPAVVQVDAIPGVSFEGKVIRVAPVLDPSTRTAALQIEIPNPKAQLKPGMYARVSITFNRRPRAEVLPLASLLDLGQEQDSKLFVVSGDPPQVELRHVKTGASDGSMIEILSGLTRDERVVTLGNRMIEPGQRIEPLEESPRLVYQTAEHTPHEPGKDDANESGQ